MFALLTLTLGVAVGAPPDTAAIPEATVAKIQKSLNDMTGTTVTVDHIAPSVFAGLYEVAAEGEVFYVSGDGQYALLGQLVNLATRQNYTEETRERLQRERVADLRLDQEDAIVFKPAGETRYVVTVFTDVDCAYCRRLHALMQDYNDLGIEIRYLAYPRAGMGSASFKTMEAVWCSKDRSQALTDAKAGKSVNADTCTSPVEHQLALANKLKLQGTPSLILPNGDLVPGYMAPADLARKLATTLSLGDAAAQVLSDASQGAQPQP
jgi:thiol:disulfide interchange protein DsbC